jgi:hypothetical protein
MKNRYGMLLEAIIKNTWVEHEDYADLKNGLTKVEEVKFSLHNVIIVIVVTTLYSI